MVTGKVDTAKEMLELIDEFLARHPGAGATGFGADPSSEQAKLWDVLTALRGPDHRDQEWMEAGKVKHQTTVKLRAAAFPKAAKALTNFVLADFESDAVFSSSAAHRIGSHFHNHIRLAASALHGMGREL